MDYKIYCYDFDNNLLNLDTKIHMIKDGELVRLTTEEFATVRKNPLYSPVNGEWEQCFTEFRDIDGKSTFLADVKFAVENKKYAPSYFKFIETLKEGRLFSIITARGNAPLTIRKGIEHIITTLSPTEKQEMLENLKKFGLMFNKDIPNDELISKYLDGCDFIPISSPEFLATINKNLGGVHLPEELKKIAIKRFIERVVGYGKRIEGEYSSFSIGFSEDDKHTLNDVKKMISDELIIKYPYIKFVLYDTSDSSITNGRKIIITPPTIRELYLKKFPSKRIKG